jgi:DnaJ family protein C protein 13
LTSSYLNLINNQKVETILGASRIWKDFKDQKHDLFITTTTTAGYLTNSVPSVAGYLTAGPGGLANSSAEKVPPPDLDLE